MKFEVAIEYVSHWALRYGVIIFCGGFLTTLFIIMGGGFFAVKVLGAPIGTLSIEVATTLYGLGALVLFHGLTRFWLLKESIAEWDNLGKLHRHALARLRR